MDIATRPSARWLFRSVWCAVLLVGTMGLAGEGPFGLPKPIDPNRPGALVLHGGGRITSETFSYFVARAGGKNARIVFVPSAGFRPSDYSSRSSFLSAVSNRYGSWASLERNGHVARFEFLFTDSPADANDPDFVLPLHEATGIWFSGGKQDRLNYRFVGHPQPTLFQRELLRVLARGGVVGGTSAGTAAIPEVMTIREYRSGDDPAQAVLAHGFGLCDRVVVEQHFDGRNGRFERFLNTLRNNEKLNRLARSENAGAQMLGVAAEEGTAVILQGSQVGVLGTGKGHLFLKSPDNKSLSWEVISPLERGEVVIGQDGRPNYVREALVRK